MTAPIQEPTESRTTSGLGYGQRQLFRRPAPATGSSDIPWARRSRPYTSAVQATTSGSFTPFDMVNDYNMGTGESGEAWFQPETSGSADGIIVQQDAFIILRVSLIWDSVVNATWWPYVSINPAAAGSTRLMFPEWAGTSATTQKGTWEFHDRVQTGDIIIAGVWQSAGTPRNVQASYLEVAVLGTWTGDPPQDMDPGDI